MTHDYFHLYTNHNRAGTESKTSLLIALVALPGYFVAVALIDRLGPRWIQTQVRTL